MTIAFVENNCSIILMKMKKFTCFIFSIFASITLFALGDCKTNNGIEDFNLCKKAAEQGSAVDQFILGRMYYEGEVVEQNYEEAFKWIKKSAEKS